jgi:hypothetical protein
MGYDVHVGGTTALSQQGHDHYLRLGSNAPIWVYGDTIPTWLTKLPLDAAVQTRKMSLFADASLGLTNMAAAAPGTLPWDWQLRMSTPERAIMEAMDELPDHASFHNLDMVFEGLTTLRPKMLSELLAGCKRIKVKRLFWQIAAELQLPVLKKIDVSEVNFGSKSVYILQGEKNLVLRNPNG